MPHSDIMHKLPFVEGNGSQRHHMSPYVLDIIRFLGGLFCVFF